MRHSFLFVAVFGLLTLVTFRPSAIFAQKENDKKVIEEARAHYLTRPIPGSIACGVTVDWDDFAKKMNLPVNDQSKAQLDILKALKISFVTTGEKHTEVTVAAAADTPSNLGDGLRQQINGFFQVYWSMAYGGFLPASGEPYELTTLPEGYSINASKDSVKAIIDMDKEYKVTHFRVDSTAIAADMDPLFSKEGDNLLHLQGIKETINMGETKMVVNIGFDDQKLNGFYVPLHMNMSLPGSFSFSYTLTACEVKAKADEPAAKSPASPSGNAGPSAK